MGLNGYFYFYLILLDSPHIIIRSFLFIAVQIWFKWDTDSYHQYTKTKPHTPLGYPKTKSHTPLGYPKTKPFTPLGYPKTKSHTPLGYPKTKSHTPLGYPKIKSYYIKD